MQSRTTVDVIVKLVDNQEQRVMVDDSKTRSSMYKTFFGDNQEHYRSAMTSTKNEDDTTNSPVISFKEETMLQTSYTKSDHTLSATMQQVLTIF